MSTSTLPAGERRAGLARDAALTVGTRFILAVLIFGTDIALARLLGPSAKGRFAIVLLYSQLVALVLGWGMDQALAVAAGKDIRSARQGFANAVIWTGVVGGIGALVSAWGYGLGQPGPPSGPLVAVLPHLSTSQFLYAAVAIPGELFFSIALMALVGRRQIAAYSGARIIRRMTLLILILATAAIARLSLSVALALNLLALGLSALAIILVARKGGFLSITNVSRPLLRDELGYGTRAVPGALAERLQFRADSFLVNLFIGVKATGIYSVTSGLAETLWYVPNALGVVMFSRAVDPRSDAGSVAAMLTRATVAIALLMAVPAFLVGPYLVRLVYGSTFADAGVALRYILPGIVAYSVVAILTRYLSGRGRPGTTTLIMGLGLAVNVAANFVLIPRLGINGAALASTVSYGLTAVVTVAIFARVSGRSVVETLLIQPADLRRAGTTLRRMLWHPGEMTTDPTADLVVGEHEIGGEE